MKKVFAFLLAAVTALLSLTMPANADEDVLKRDLETVRAIADTIQAEYFTPEEMIRVEVRLRVSDEGEESIFVGPVLTQNGSPSLFFRLFNQYVKESDVTSEIFLTYGRVNVLDSSKMDLSQYTYSNTTENSTVKLNDAVIMLHDCSDEITKGNGDVDCSGTVDVTDSVLLARYCSEDQDAVLTAEGKANADANGDGVVTMDDVTEIQQIITKLK